MARGRSTITSSTSDDTERRAKKQNLYHIWIKPKEDVSIHYLVPTYTEIAMSSPGVPGPHRKGKFPASQTSISGIYEDHFDARMVSQDSGYGSRTESLFRDSIISFASDAEDVRTSDGISDEVTDEWTDELPDTLESAGLQEKRFSESISVAILEAEPNYTYISCCDDSPNNRYVTWVRFGLGLKPEAFSQRLVVFRDSTRQKYKNTVFVNQRPKPVAYRETCVLRDKFPQPTYASLLDYHQERNPRWFRNSVSMWPKSYSAAQVSKFEINNNMASELQSPFTPSVNDEVFQSLKPSLSSSSKNTFSSSVTVKA